MACLLHLAVIYLICPEFAYVTVIMAVAIMLFSLKSVVLNGMSPSNPSSQGSGDYAEEEAERLYIYKSQRG